MASLRPPGGLVFATGTGTITDPSNPATAPAHLSGRSGLPLKVRFHGLRRTCATLLSRDLRPEQSPKMLGYSYISVTPDAYSHLLPDMQEKALEEALI